MTEEEPKPEDKKPEDKKRGELSLIDEAHMAAERLEHANKVMESLVKRQEAIEARRVLGGYAEAGAPMAREMSADEKWAKEAKIRYKGTGMDPT